MKGLKAAQCAVQILCGNYFEFRVQGLGGSELGRGIHCLQNWVVGLRAMSLKNDCGDLFLKAKGMCEAMAGL